MNVRDLPLREAKIAQALARLELKEAAEESARFLSDAADDPVGPDPLAAPLIRARWMAAKVDLATGQLAHSLAHVEFLTSFAERFTPEFACHFWLLTAEAHARLGRHSSARIALARLVHDSLSVCQQTPLLQLRWLRIRLWLGEMDQIERELRFCRDQLRGDAYNTALLLLDSGRAREEAGDLDAAEACWREALETCSGTDTDPVRAEILIQLGRTAQLRGQLQPALDHLAEAGKCAGAQTPAPVEIRLREALVWAELGQVEPARRHVEKLFAEPGHFADELQSLARTVGDLLGLSAELSGLAEVAAWQAARRGDRRQAATLYRALLEKERAPVRQARFGLALALLERAEGLSSEATARLAEVERLARLHELPEVLWRCLEAQGTWAVETGADDARALTWLEEAILISETQGAQLRHGVSAAVYHLKRASLLRLMLRGKCRRGDAAGVFHYQELERGRLLLELHRAAGRRRMGPHPGEDDPELASLDEEIALCEQLVGLDGVTANQNAQLVAKHVQLSLRRDRLLEAHLTDRSRRDDSRLPVLPTLAEFAEKLPAGTVCLSASVLEDELYLVVVRRGEGAKVVPVSEGAGRIVELVKVWRDGLRGALASYRQRCFGPRERAALDEPLWALGHSGLGQALFELVREGERLLWVPDDALHGLPVPALRRDGRRLIERVEIVHAFSAASALPQTTRRSNGRRRANLVVAESADVLPFAEMEGQRVGAALRHCRRFRGAEASRDRLRTRMAEARVMHFACHALFDAAHPLSAYLRLPSGENWRLLDWLDEPAAGLPLLTLSACRSAEVAPLVGREVFGLVTAALASGVQTVLAGLWPVADRETVSFMGRFYRELMLACPATALARTQRALVNDSHPLFWAVFALFGDPNSLPGPCFFLSRWWRRWQAARHARRFPDVLPPLPARLESPS